MADRGKTSVLVNRRVTIGYKLALLAVSVLLVSCVGDETTETTESVTTSAVGSPVPTTTVVTTTTTMATTTTLAPPAVAAEFPQRGSAAPLWDDDAYASSGYRDLLGRLAAAGAEWVTVVPTWYQADLTSSAIYAETPGRTTTDEALIEGIRAAQALGFRVVLKPHVDPVEGGGRVGIQPDAEDAWFESYTEMILGYARLAEAEDVDQLVVGTEFRGISTSSEAWRTLISRVREVFSGPLTYAANHDEYDQIEFWEDLDFIGVDAYFPLGTVPSTDVSALTERWDEIADRLEQLAAATGRTVVFTEVGYPSQEGAITQPFNPSTSDVVSEEEQAAALQAMLDAVGDESWFGGLHWWMWYDEETSAAAELSYMPEGKLAGQILEEYWSGG